MDVIEATPDRAQWVSLECATNPNSIPKPRIEWRQYDTGSNGEATVLVEDTITDTIRFIDNGQYLILETTSDAISGKGYFCNVTNNTI